MKEEIKCDICHKNIKVNDDIVLGSKDNYLLLPEDIQSANVVFLHSECFKKYLEEQKSGNN